MVPEPKISVDFGQTQMLPTFVMTLTLFQPSDREMLPSQKPGDLLAGKRQLIANVVVPSP